MKNFLFSSEILPPVSSFMFAYLHERNLSILWHVSMCLQYLTQERGILHVPTSLSPSDSFILMNQISDSYWFSIGNLFYDITTKRQWRRHSIPKQSFFPQLIPTPAPVLVSEESALLTRVRAENGTVLSLVTTSVGFTMEGFPPSSLLLAELSMKILGAEDL